MMMFYRKLCLLILIAFLSACAVGPDYVRPRAITLTNLPTHYKEQKNSHVTYHQLADDQNTPTWKKACPLDTADRGEWWRIFHDAYLNHLEQQATVANQNIINAKQNYLQAHALVDEARANFFPTLSGNLTVTRQKQIIGSMAPVSTSVSTAGSSPIYNSHSLGLTASWVPDIWGQVRRTVESNTAAAEASAALLAATRLSTQGSLAVYYFELRGLDVNQKILNDTVRNDQQALQLTRQQYRSGIVSEADVIQARTQLETTQAQAINNGILRGQYEHAIAVLIGMPPEKFSIIAKPKMLTVPRIPLDIPSALLERRPDIAQAERTMAQNNAQIGVAESAYFPTLTLSGAATASSRSAALANLFRVPGLNWSYGPQLTALLFDGGLRSATVSAARHGYSASVAAYRQTVLAAFQNVEDQLIALRLLTDQNVQTTAAANNARLALRLVVNQYKAGIVPYSSVITAQVTALSAEENAANVTYQRLTAAVNLIVALGGRWD